MITAIRHRSAIGDQRSAPPRYAISRMAHQSPPVMPARIDSFEQCLKAQLL